MPDKAWKKLERRIGKLLGGERVKRMGDYSQSATDVIVPDLPQLKIDCKLRRGFAHHKLFLKIKARRANAVLVTRESSDAPALASFKVEDFVALIGALRNGGRPARSRWVEGAVERPRFKHHALHREVGERYCRQPGEVPVLITKEHRKQTYLVTIDAGLFDALRRGDQNSFFGVRPISSRTASAAGFAS